MSKLSKSQIKGLENKIGWHQPVALMCDGFKVTLNEYRYKNSIRIVIYVDGWSRGKWLQPGSKFPESKFFPFMKIRVKQNVLDPKCRKMETVTLENRTHDFANAGQALRHLNKVCDSVEPVVDVDAETQRHRDALFATLSEGDDQ